MPRTASFPRKGALVRAVVQGVLLDEVNAHDGGLAEVFDNVEGMLNGSFLIVLEASLTRFTKMSFSEQLFCASTM
jgi:hypothetical protein